MRHCKVFRSYVHTRRCSQEEGYVLRLFRSNSECHGRFVTNTHTADCITVRRSCLCISRAIYQSSLIILNDIFAIGFINIVNLFVDCFTKHELQIVKIMRTNTKIVNFHNVVAFDKIDFACVVFDIICPTNNSVQCSICYVYFFTIDLNRIILIQRKIFRSIVHTASKSEIKLTARCFRCLDIVGHRRRNTSRRATDCFAVFSAGFLLDVTTAQNNAAFLDGVSTVFFNCVLIFNGFFAFLYKQIVGICYFKVCKIQFTIPLLRHIKSKSKRATALIKSIPVCAEGCRYFYPSFSCQFFSAIYAFIIDVYTGSAVAEIVVIEHLIEVTVKIFRRPSVEGKGVVCTKFQVIDSNVENIRTNIVSREHFGSIGEIKLNRFISFRMFLFTGNRNDVLFFRRFLVYVVVIPNESSGGVMPRA